MTADNGEQHSLEHGQGPAPDHDHGHDHSHGHGHDHSHGHGHANDQGLAGALRYLRFAPRMWRSELNDVVVATVAPMPGERVVDIGAGMGAAAMPATRTGAMVIAVEPTPFMRRVLKVRRLGQRHRSRLTVRDGAAEALPMEDGAASAVWSVNAMHHWVDPKTAAAEIARVLRPGGRVLLVDEAFNDPAHPDYDRFGRDHGPEHHGFTMVEADQMGTLLTEAGLAEVEATDQTMAGRPVLAVTAKR